MIGLARFRWFSTFVNDPCILILTLSVIVKLLDRPAFRFTVPGATTVLIPASPKRPIGGRYPWFPMRHAVPTCHPGVPGQVYAAALNQSPAVGLLSLGLPTTSGA